MKRLLQRHSFVLMFVLASCRSEQEAAPAPVADVPVESATRLLIRNVDIQLTSSAAVHIEELRGELAGTNGQTINFDDSRSYAVNIADSKATLTPENLARLLNDHAFAYKDAPVKKLEIRLEGGEMHVKGSLNKAIDVPFEIRGRPEVTADGEIALRATSIRAAGVPVKGLLDIIGADVADVVDEKRVPGMRIVNDTVFVSVRILPPPALVAGFSAVSVGSDRIAVSLSGGATPGEFSGPQGENYLRVEGGPTQFLNMTMHRTKLQLLDATPPDPLKFNLYNYRPQLVAGAVRVEPGDGLVIQLGDQ